jgi:flagellar motility protein MotE (MotC chaperone)
MRIGSLLILGAVFISAFAGRAGVLAARSVEQGDLAPVRQCIDGAFAEELKKQAERLDRAAADQASEDQKRAVIVQHVNSRIAELEKAASAYAASAQSAVGKEGAAAGKVAALYERMKPELAGEIVGGMDPSFAASLLLAMNSESASSILGALPPGRAYAITVIMADAS